MKYALIILPLAGTLLYSSCKSKGDSPATETVPSQHTEEEEHDHVRLSSQQIGAAGIAWAPLESKNLEVSIKVNGRLEVPAQNKAAVTSLYSGVLQQIYVHPGSTVRKGQVIARIANTELTGIQQDLISVNARLKLARLEYDRQQELVSGNAAPLKNLQQAEAELSSLSARQTALQKQLSLLGIDPAAVSKGTISSSLTITAPISGAISDIHAQIGSKIDPATPVAGIVNNSQLHLDLFVYEKDLPNIKPGQKIHFTLTNSPGKEYDATIFSIGTAFANDSRSVPVHAEVEGDKNGLIEGMSVTAVISIGNRTAPALPTAAIVSNAGKDYIFVLAEEASAEEHDHEGEHTAQNEAHEHDADGSRTFERVQVIRGASDLGYTEIQPVIELPPGAQIIVKGAFFVMAKMTNTGGHEH